LSSILILICEHSPLHLYRLLDILLLDHAQADFFAEAVLRFHNLCLVLLLLDVGDMLHLFSQILLVEHQDILVAKGGVV